MSLRLKTLKCLNFGDVIILDNFKPKYENGVLTGNIFAQWDDYLLSGEIVIQDGQHMFSPKTSMLWTQKEDALVEEVHILDAKNHNLIDEPADKNSKFVHLANNIRVQLNVELARLPLTLKEVCELREGSIVDLKRKLDDPLALVVEGRVIGHCTPVKIDGRLGIKILQLLDQDSLQS